jgi:hypothetical protein
VAIRVSIMYMVLTWIHSLICLFLKITRTGLANRFLPLRMLTCIQSRLLQGKGLLQAYIPQLTASDILRLGINITYTVVHCLDDNQAAGDASKNRAHGLYCTVGDKLEDMLAGH